MRRDYQFGRWLISFKGWWRPVMICRLEEDMHGPFWAADWNTKDWEMS